MTDLKVFGLGAAEGIRNTLLAMGPKVGVVEDLKWSAIHARATSNILDQSEIRSAAEALRSQVDSGYRQLLAGNDAGARAKFNGVLESLTAVSNVTKQHPLGPLVG